MRISTLTLLFAGALCLACGGGGNRQKGPVVVHPKSTPTAVGDFEVEVHGSQRRGGVGGKFVNYAAPDGATLLIVDVSVKNGGKKPMAMAGRFQLLQDDRVFNPTTECQIALKGNWPLLEQVNPGIRRRAKVCFEVPKDAKGFEFGMKAGLFSRPEHFALE